MAKAKSAPKAGSDWEPLPEHERQAERADQLLILLERAQDDLKDHAEEGREIKAQIRDLKQQLKTAKRLSVPQRARINTLDRKWRRQWVKYYDEYREGGKPKQDAAALAWSRIKIHCSKLPDDEWRCPPWEDVLGPKARRKKRKKKKK